MSKLILSIVTLASTMSFVGCGTDAQLASRNLSQAADMFEIDRRVVFYDAIQGKYLLLIEGRCSIEHDQTKKQLAVTCKTSPTEYKKHFLGLSDNVTYFAEQVKTASVNVYQYRVIFKPETIVPNIELSTSNGGK